MAEIELAPKDRAAEIIDKLVVGVPSGHSPNLYQRFVDTSTIQSLIAALALVDNKQGVGFGSRLLAMIEKSEWENQRRFAIEAMGWPESSGPQRLGNYIKSDRVPKDRNVLRRMAEKLKTTPETLLNESSDEALRDILLQLLELSGTPAGKADTIASALFEAKRLLSVYPQEGDLALRARLAAHSAWHQLSHPEPGISPHQT